MTASPITSEGTMTDKTEAIRRARDVVALLEREGNPKAADSVRAVIQELVYIDGLAKEYHGKLSEYVQHFDQKEEDLRQREAQLSARQAAPDGWRLVPVKVAEEMHVAAVKVLHRANGVDGLPQRMLDAMLSAAPPPPERETKCWCETCRPVTLSDMRMVLCPDCGKKRCPKATHHDNARTNSNAPGQPGSSWEHVKPHGATND